MNRPKQQELETLQQNAMYDEDGMLLKRIRFDVERFGRTVDFLRLRRGFSYYKLELATGVYNSMIQRLVKESCMWNIESILSLCKFFGLKIEDFISERDPDTYE